MQKLLAIFVILNMMGLIISTPVAYPTTIKLNTETDANWEASPITPGSVNAFGFKPFVADGQSDYLEISMAAPVAIDLAQGVTIAGWLNYAYAANKPIFKLGTASDDMIKIETNSNTDEILVESTDNTNIKGHAYAFPSNADTFFCVTITNVGVQTAYINTFSAAKAPTGAGPNDITAGSLSLTSTSSNIGLFATDDGSSTFWAGTFSGFQVFEGILDADQLLTTICNIGFYATPSNAEANAPTCTACDGACVQCYGSATTCTACAVGKYLSASGNTCSTCDTTCTECSGTATTCTACAAGKKLVGNTCEDCVHPCVNCDANGCIDCVTSSAAARSAPDCACPDLFFDNAGAANCVACDPKCATCETSATHCLTCAGIDQGTAGARIVTDNLCNCPTGWYDNLGDDNTAFDCVICPGSNICNTCTSAGCDTCVDTTKSGLLCNICAAAHWDNSGTCTPCPTGCSACSSATVCSDCVGDLVGAANGERDVANLCACPTGWADDGADNCVLCNDNCLTCAGDDKDACVTCQESALVRIAVTDTVKSCNCPAGSWDEGVAECTACDVICETCEANDACVTCAGEREGDDCACPEGWVEYDPVQADCKDPNAVAPASGASLIFGYIAMIIMIVYVYI